MGRPGFHWKATKAVQGLAGCTWSEMTSVL
jgi:hypothetical protein